MSRAIAKTETPKTNLENITRFIIYQDVVLNTDQEQLMQRLYFTDEKLRSRKFKRDEIIQLVKNRFSISSWRAEQDICDAQKLFGATRTINKNYLLSQHIDDIQLQIQLVKDAKRFELLQGLNNALTNAVNAIPPEAKYQDITPTRIIFINNTMKAGSGKSVEQLVAEAEAMIKATPTTDDDYAEFEELDEEPGPDD